MLNAGLPLKYWVILLIYVFRHVFQIKATPVNKKWKFKCDKVVLQFDSFYLKNLLSDIKTQLFGEIPKHLRIERR